MNTCGNCKLYFPKHVSNQWGEDGSGWCRLSTKDKPRATGDRLMPRKDYQKEFVALARKRAAWFNVDPSGRVIDIQVGYYREERHLGLRFGTKAAYDWLVDVIKEASE